MNAARLGIDVGGSALKLGCTDADGEILGEESVDVGSRPELDALLGEVAQKARKIHPTFAGVGLGLPGLLDRGQGRVEKSPNLPWLEQRPVREMAARALDLPAERVLVENDANVAALAEQWRGAARHASNALIATLGTGIGGGLILDGRLYTGEGMAGEVGHLVIDPEGPLCGCGRHGCLEQYASASAARRRAGAAGLPQDRPGDLEHLTELAKKSPGPERKLLEEVGRDLGHGFALVVSLLDVRTFVVGGGFGRALPLLLPGIRRGLSEWAYGERVESLQVLPAELEARAGWVGAARLVDLHLKA